MGAAIRHPVSDWVKQSLVIFNIRALWCHPYGNGGRQRVNCDINAAWQHYVIDAYWFHAKQSSSHRSGI